MIDVLVLKYSFIYDIFHRWTVSFHMSCTDLFLHFLYFEDAYILRNGTEIKQILFFRITGQRYTALFYWKYRQTQHIFKEETRDVFTKRKNQICR